MRTISPHRRRVPAGLSELLRPVRFRQRDPGQGYSRESEKERGCRLVFASSPRLEDEQETHRTQEAAARGGRETLQIFDESVEHSYTSKQSGPERVAVR
jgi:hypothetical protein